METKDKIILLTIGILLSLFYIFIQPVASYNNGRFWDSHFYCNVTEQFSYGLQPSEAKPFVYRIGVPLLTSFIGGNDTVLKFKIVNCFFWFGILFVVLELIGFFFNKRIIVYLVYIIFLFTGFFSCREIAFIPALVDYAFIFLSLLTFYFFLKWEKLTVIKVIVLCILVFINSIVREIGAVIPIVGLFAYVIQVFKNKKIICVSSLKQLIISLLPVVAGIAGIVLTHLVVKAYGEYTFLSHLIYSITAKLSDPLRYILAIFNAFGPIFLLFLFLKKESYIQITKNQMFLFYWIGICILALIGGEHSERFFSWGLISLLIMYGYIIKSLLKENKIILITILVSFALLQIIATRAFLPAPDLKSIISYVPDPEFYFLAPYGENAHIIHNFALKMSDGLKFTLFIQYCILIVYFVILRIALVISNKIKKPASLTEN